MKQYKNSQDMEFTVPVGYLIIVGSINIAVYNKPNYIHLKFMKWFFGWKWIDN